MTDTQPKMARSLPVLSTDALTPFVGSQADEVTHAIRALFDIESDLPLDWRTVESHGRRHLAIEFGTAPDDIGLLALGLVDAGTPDRDRPPSLRTRFSKGRTASARALRARLAAALTRSSREVAPLLRRLARALEAHLRFAEMRDVQFRKVSSSPDGRYGTLRLGYRCNQDCHFCWQDRDWPAPPESRYFEWLDEMGRAGLRALNITGGEPTAYKALLPLIEKAHREYGMAVSIQSNAIALAQPKYLDKLVRAGLVGVMASYHSSDAEISDAMTRAPGTHIKTREGIANALEAGLIVTLNCVVEEQNVDTLPDQAADIVARFIEPFPDNPPHRVTYAHPTGYQSDGLWDDSQRPFDEIRPSLVAAARIIHRAGVPVQITGTCGFPRCMLHGEPELLAQQPLQRELFDRAQLAHLYFSEACEHCEARDECFGLRPEYLARFGDRGLIPFT